MLDLPDDVEDVPVDNVPLRSRTFGRHTVEGYSRAGVQTYWRIPEMKLLFDAGLSPWSFVGTPTLALSHTHLDHLAALPVWVSRRRMMKMAPPTVYLPMDAVDDVHALFQAYRRLDGGRLPCDLVGCEPGDEFDLSRELTLKAIEVEHRGTALGYIVYGRKRKLKGKYADLAESEIRDLALRGVRVSREVRTPLVAYMGDTNPYGLDDNPEVYDARILIVEMTFVDPGHRPVDAHRHGHIHLQDIVERADEFDNDAIVAGHLSTRCHDDRIRRIVERKLPDSLRGRLHLWL